MSLGLLPLSILALGIHRSEPSVAESASPPVPESTSNDRAALLRQSLPSADSGELAPCATAARRKNPEAGGQVDIELTVAASGAVSEVKVVKDTVGEESGFASCLGSRFGQWVFAADSVAESKPVAIAVSFRVEELIAAMQAATSLPQPEGVEPQPAGSSPEVSAPTGEWMNVSHRGLEPVRAQAVYPRPAPNGAIAAYHRQNNLELRTKRQRVPGAFAIGLGAGTATVGLVGITILTLVDWPEMGFGAFGPVTLVGAGLMTGGVIALKRHKRRTASWQAPGDLQLSFVPTSRGTSMGARWRF